MLVSTTPCLVKVTIKKNSVALVRKRTIPTERPPLVGEVSANFLRVEGVAWSAQRIPTAINLGFLDRSRYFFIQVAPQLSSRGWADPVPDPILLRKSGRAGNRTRDLWICSQKLWPLDHRVKERNRDVAFHCPPCLKMRWIAQGLRYRSTAEEVFRVKLSK
jgi:hypothetical protein